MLRRNRARVAVAAASLTFTALAIAIVPNTASAQCSVSDGILQQTAPSERSDSVRCLQQTLNEKGYNSGPVDGWFGPVTEAAVTAFQRDAGVAVDGWMGRETRTALGIERADGGGGDSTPRVEAASSNDSRPAPAPAPRRQRSSGGGGCDGIYAEFRAQGASDSVARNFAYHIAPRESGCTLAFVHDNDDWSLSRLGLNAGPHGENVSAWRNLCGADVRSDTRSLSVDVRCALAAYHHSGWSPWTTA